jgi:hypothetical protein
LRKKCVKVTVKTGEVEGCEIGEPFEETVNERASWSIDSDRESKTVSDREKLFRNDRNRSKVVAVDVVSMTVAEKFEDRFPALIRQI